MNVLARSDEQFRATTIAEVLAAGNLMTQDQKTP